MKIKTVTVSYPWPNPNDALRTNMLFRVERVTDSVELTPGQFLNKAEVADLCASKGWKLTSTTNPGWV